MDLVSVEFTFQNFWCASLTVNAGIMCLIEPYRFRMCGVCQRWRRICLQDKVIARIRKLYCRIYNRPEEKVKRERSKLDLLSSLIPLPLLCQSVVNVSLISLSQSLILNPLFNRSPSIVMKVSICKALIEKLMSKSGNYYMN